MKSPQELLSEAIRLHRGGELKRAEKLYRSILAENGRNADVMHLLGVINLQRSRPNKAISLIEKAIRLSPAIPRYYSNLGHALSAVERIKEAEECFVRALKLSPNFLEARYNLGNLYLNRGERTAAVACYRAVIAQRSDHAAALNNLGLCLKEEAKLEEAERCLKAAIRLRPKVAEWRCNLGELYLRSERVAEARASFVQSIECGPNLAAGHLGIGISSFRLGRAGEARAAFEKVVALDDRQPIAHSHLGTLASRDGKREAAYRHFHRAVQLAPDNARYHLSLGLACQELGYRNQAREQMERALTLNPASEAADYNLKLLKRFDVDWPAGADALTRSAEADPRNADLSISLARACWNAHRYGDSLRTLDSAALRAAPTIERDYWRGLVWRSKGDFQEARRWWERVVKADPHHVNARAGMFSIEAAWLRTLGEGSSIPKVAFHMNADYHFGIMKPVFGECRERFATLVTSHLTELIEFKPAAVVVAESHASILRSFLPDSISVYLRHGLISKRTAAYGARAADYVCITNEATRQWFLNKGGIPRKGFWITGFSQMDPLFRGETLPLPFSLPDGKPVILYAPSWNREFTSAGMLGTRLVDLIRVGCPNCSIIIKPHPILFQREPEWVDTWRNLSQIREGVFLVDQSSADIASYLAAADLLLSDASTVMFQFLACDRPIVLITNPARSSSSFYDPERIEWKWRDLGIEIENIEDLPAAIRASLSDPAVGRERRAFYRQKLFGKLTDGRAGERIALEIGRLFDKRD